MTKAFDTALFVPAPDPDIGQAVGAGNIGPPFQSDWYYYVIASGPGVTLGASVPAATDEGQILLSGPGPTYQWLTAYQLYLGSLPTFPSTNPAPGAPPVPKPGTMFFNTSDSTPYILTGVTGAISDWTPLPVAGANRVVVNASVPKATGPGQMIVADSANQWQASVGMFYGAHPAPPTMAPGGTPIQVGAIYYNTSNGQVYVWDGSGWKSLSAPNKAATATLYYQSIANQTDFPTTINDLFGQTHTFDPLAPEEVEVHLNGVLLMPDGGGAPGDFTVDYTTSTITLLAAAPTSSILAVDIMQDPVSLSPTLVLIELLQPFVFDGTTTTFPLIIASSGLGVATDDPSNLMVHVDGVMQEPGVDYVLDVTGKSIIFAAAPSADAQNFVILFAKSKIGFLSQVDHDATLTGNGTATNPLSVVPATTVQRGAVFIPGLADVPPSNLTINPSTGKLGATVALQTQIQAGADNVQPVTSQTLRGVMGAPVSSLTTTAKTVVPAVNELLVNVNTRVLRAGDTMTGPLIQAADPVAPLGTATKQYVDTADALNVKKAGDTMTGPLIQAADPVNVLGTATKQYVDNTTVSITGDTMTGFLTLNADPATALEAATKRYVDVSIASHVLYQGTWQVAANVPDLHVPPNVPLNGYSYTAVTAVAGTPETVPVGIPGIAGQSVNTGDTIQWNGGSSVWQLIAGSSLSILQGDARYINATGDTMTGVLTLAGNPATALEAAPKQYVDTADALNVKKAGDTMTGQLITIAPVAPGNATNKAYVDAADNLRVLKAGDTMTGQLVTIAPVAAGDAANKGYVDAADALRVLKAGDTMTGQLITIAPVAPGDATNKAYVDAADTLRVLKAGDTMTGDLILPATAPAVAQAATPKSYVDAAIATQNLYQGTWQVAANNPDLNVPGVLYPAGTPPLNGYTWIASTVDPNVAETALAGIPGIGGMTIYNGDTIKWNTGLGAWDRIQGSSLTITQADSRYLALAGGTLTGALTLAADPVAALQPVTQQYLGTQLASYILKTGDTMSGNLNLPATAPTLPTEATNKLYVDTTVAANSLYQGIYTVTTNIPDLRIPPMAPLNGYSWVTQTTDPLVPDNTTIALPGIPLGTPLDSGWTIRYNGGTLLYEVIKGPNISLTTAAGQFVDVVGDTMTGALKIDMTNATFTPALVINKTIANSGTNSIAGTTSDKLRWQMYLGGNDNETGTLDTGSSFRLFRYNDPGTLPNLTMEIQRYNGYATAFPTLAVDLNINKATPKLNLQSNGTGQFAGIQFYDNGTANADIRWHINKTSAAETGSNNGSDFAIDAFQDSGSFWYTALKVSRVNGQITTVGPTNTNRLETRAGGGSAAAGLVQIGMGYNNQAGCTYRHEIRTTHDGTTPGKNNIEFWLHRGNADTQTAAPTANPFTLWGDQITTNAPFTNAITVSYSGGTLIVKDTNNAPNPYPAGNFDAQGPRGTCARFTGTQAPTGNNDCKAQVWNNNGGWGWQSGFEMQTNSPPKAYFGSDVSVGSLTNRSSREIKEDIRYVEPRDIAGAFDRLKLVRYRNRDRPWPVDENGERLPEMPEQPEEWKRERIGVIVEDLKADKDLGKMVFGEGDQAGYDIGQMLTLCMAKIKQLELKIVTLEGKKH